MLKIKKKHFFILFILFCLILGLGIFYFINQDNKTATNDLACTAFKDRYVDNYQCGYVNSDESNKYHHIIGKVLGKYEENNEYIIEVGLLNAKGEKIIEKIQLPPDTIKTSISILKLVKKPNPEISFAANEENKLFTGKEVMKRIEKNEELLIQVATPSKKAIENLEKQIGKSDYTKCLAHNQKFIDYLVSSNVQSDISKTFHKLISQCDVVTINITKFE